jgi:hypothetical protein
MATVYIESTIVSYFTARDSSAPLVAARQRITRDWWNVSRQLFDVCRSQAVLDEIAAGNPELAAERQSLMKDIRLLPGAMQIDDLASKFAEELQIPSRAAADAVHLAYVVHFRVDYLLTWNCTHLANPSLQLKLHRYNMRQGLWLPMLATPEQLLYKPPGGAL